MNKEQRLKWYIKKFYKKYKNYKIIYVKNCSSSFYFTDELGFLRYKQNIIRAVGYELDTYSVVNRLEYFNYFLKQRHKNLEILKIYGIKNKCIVKDDNGFIYEPQLYDLLNCGAPQITTCTEKFKLFKYKANLKHNYKYSYIKFDYKNGKQKASILCEEHGIFKQIIESHLEGRGCPKCKKVCIPSKNYINNHSKKNVIIYIVELNNDSEKFIKIGVTSNLKRRLSGFLPYIPTILKTYDGYTFKEAHDIEKYLNKNFNEFKYTPIQDISGKTECYNIKILKEEKLYEQFKK